MGNVDKRMPLCELFYTDILSYLEELAANHSMLHICMPIRMACHQSNVLCRFLTKTTDPRFQNGARNLYEL